MTIEEQIEILQAAKGGLAIECKYPDEKDWVEVYYPNRIRFDFKAKDYRLKPEEPVDDEIFKTEINWECFPSLISPKDEIDTWRLGDLTEGYRLIGFEFIGVSYDLLFGSSPINILWHKDGSVMNSRKAKYAIWQKEES
jgi:hypothetical protein